MNRVLLFLVVTGLLAAAGTAAFQQKPGYMDADYYFMTGRSLARGAGFTEPVLWNYLDDPAGLPHPSHAYWMPLTSILAAAGMALAGADSFDAAQAAFVLVAGLVPALTAVLAARFHAGAPPHRQQQAALLAGLLAIFSGYYVGFLTTTDSFGLYMALGSVFLLLQQRAADRPLQTGLLAGTVAGLMHLTRADGILWLLLAPLGAGSRQAGKAGAAALGGYLLVMGAWFARNLAVFGRPLAPGGSRALWWTGYNDVFAFPAAQLTAERWLASGWPAILAARLDAAAQNFTSAFAVNGLIFLFPLMAAGLWQLRARTEVRLGAAGLGLAFLLMSVVFPFAGARGGFFHAAASVQPLLWASVPAGLDVFLRWGQQRRGWRPEEARRVFGAGAAVIALAATLLLGWIRVVQPALAAPAEVPYQAAGRFLDALGLPATTVVMVNNPPGFANETGRPAIVIPDGGLEAIRAAAARYEAQILVLGAEQGLPELYQSPQDAPGLNVLGEIEGLVIFRFMEAP